MIQTRLFSVMLGCAALFFAQGLLQQATAADAPDYLAPPAKFADPARLERLSAAFPAVDELMQQFTTREHVPGAAWGIVVDGRLAHVGVTGVRDVASSAPVQPDSVFRIASMTKSFTALAILRLRDQGKLSLDDRVDRYIPQLRKLRYPTTDSPRLTIRHLLTHSAGFPEDNPWGDQQLAISEAQFDRLLEQGIAMSNAPGVAYEYSNYGFALLGRIVSVVSGVPYARYVEQQVLRPLGMRNTTLEPEAVPKMQLAQGYRYEDGLWKLEPQLADGAFGAMGGMLTSIEDLGRYVGLYLQAWPARDGADTMPLSRASLREMQQTGRERRATVGRTAQGEPELNAGGYGYGLRVSQSCRFAHVVAHSGGLPGFGSQMRWLPEYGVGLIAFGNRTYTGWGKPFDDALELLAATGALQPRIVEPAPALVRARHGVSALLERWDDGQSRELAAMNLFLDRSLERRRGEFLRLREELGACREQPGYVSIENALRGEWRYDCERGAVLATVTLAPTRPALIQHLELRTLAATSALATAACR
ncbi:MAG: Penicillin-binding protein [Pseudomonadota bacterium]